MTARIVPASEVGGPERLQPLAERVFGEKNRPVGWFRRKLVRERVDAELSMVAVEDDVTTDATDPSAWRGYVLVGTPPSLSGAARTAGAGVVPEAGGSGLGGRLLDAACGAAASAGFETVLTLASDETVAFYSARGFAHVRESATVLAFAHGSSEGVREAPKAWTPPGVALGSTHVEACAWLEEAWEGTESFLRHTLAIPLSDGLQAWLHVSREGTAFLSHRVLLPCARPLREDVANVLADLLARAPAERPVLITGLDPAVEAARALLQSGWDVVQRGHIMARTQ